MGHRARQDPTCARGAGDGIPAALLVLVLAGSILAGCATPTSGRRRDSGRQAYGAYLRGLLLERDARLEDALDAYRVALDYDQHSPYLNVRIGETYIKLGDPDRALQSFEHALGLSPNHPDALRWIAILHTSQGRLDDAIEAYERLLPADQESRFVLATLADLYVLRGDLVQAIELYRRLALDVGSTSQTHFNLGVLHGRLDQYPEALRELSRALELSPDSLEVRVALGLTNEMAGAYENAAAHYEEAIRLDPFSPQLYAHAARAYLSGEHYAQAIANYYAVLDLNPDDFDAMMGLVRVWVAQQQFDQAQEFLGKQVERLGGSAAFYVVLGIVYREAEHQQEALRAFERAVALEEGLSLAHFYLAAQLDRLGNRDAARASLRRTIELDPNHADAMNYLGYLDAEEGVNLKEAKALIERALRLDPDNGAYMDSLGWVSYQMGRFDEAITYLEQAAELLSTDATIFDHLGDAYSRRGDLERAHASWERSLELDPGLAGVREKLDRLSGVLPEPPAGEAPSEADELEGAVSTP